MDNLLEMMEVRDQFDTVAKLCAQAQSIAALTGAGVSAESGLKTFRDPDGLWQKFSPQELANVRAFLSNPDLVQSWYRSRKRAALEAVPNAGHVALAQLGERTASFALITQNVDNLHTRAGSANVLELHGNLLRNYCIDCLTPASIAVDSVELQKCDTCGGLIRPDVVWFGEQLPTQILEKAHEAAVRSNVFFSIGTSAEVYPAADLPIAAKTSGAVLVEVNTATTALTRHADFVFTGPSGEILPQLVDRLVGVAQ